MRGKWNKMKVKLNKIEKTQKPLEVNCRSAKLRNPNGLICVGLVSKRFFATDIYL